MFEIIRDINHNYYQLNNLNVKYKLIKYKKIYNNHDYLEMNRIELLIDKYKLDIEIFYVYTMINISLISLAIYTIYI